MATLSLVLFKAKALKDGTHKIRIAIRHKHETCYIITRFIVQENQFNNGQVIKRPDASVINMKLRQMLNEYQNMLDDIKCQSMYSCKQIRDILLDGAGKSTDATFQTVSKSYINELLEDGRDSYAKLLERNCRYFTEFAKDDFLLSRITPEIIASYDRFLRNHKRIGETTIGMMMSRTRTIINRGVKQQLVKYELHPFTYYSIKGASIREVDITIENIRKIKDSSFKEKKYMVARDLFMLSFYLGGINLIDLLELNFKGGNTIEYVRHKARNLKQSEQRITIVVPQDAYCIIERWMNKRTGKLDFGYKFSYPNFYRYITRNLNYIAKQLDIRQKLVYYSARKTFAQFASELGIPDSVIDYCLGHSDKSRGVIRYYTKVKQRQAEIAINRVIDYVNNPYKYKDFIEMRADVMMVKI